MLERVHRRPLKTINPMETKELTIIDQVKDVELKSGVAFELDITEVVSLAKRASEIKSVEDPDFLAIKKECQQKRKYVTEYFEDARKAFNAASKGVIQVQNMVLDEFTGEENRLIALDKADKYRLIREARLEALPTKRERLNAVGDDAEIADQVILAMEDADFELFIAERIRAKAEIDRLAAEAKLAEERAAFEAEKAELARKQSEADAIENARKEERERAEEVLRIQKETAEREKKEAEERRIAEEQERVLRAEREKKEAEERTERERVDKEIAEEKRMADEKFQAFLKKNNHNDDTDIIIDGVNLYRFVAKFTD